MLGQAAAQLTPEFVDAFAQGFTSSSSWGFSIPSADEGNLMIICAGGTISRIPTLSGWNHVPMTVTGVTLIIFWKFAGAGEPTSITITWDGNIAGSIQYWEYKYVDTVNPIISGYGTPSGFSGVTSHSWGTYNVLEPSLFVADIALNISSSAISIDNGFFLQTAAGRHASGVRAYLNPAANENTTWTFDSSSGQVGLLAFRGKIL